jgi:hypothetical protein
MKVILDKENYVLGYAFIGDLDNSIEVEDFEFKHDCNYYKYDKGNIIYDKNRYDLAVKNDLEANVLEMIRLNRQSECFSIINRGKLWYDILTAKQIEELDEWYKAWLNAPETLIEPDKPIWLK